MRHGSLFSGIGGFDLAAEWVGWENIFHCEIEPFCQKVLKYHFPNSISYDDITKTDFSVHRGRIDIVTGGFPCQPFSLAGKRKGTEDNRYLWKEMLRAIQQIQPQWVVGENVFGIINWDRGMVFRQVQTDLETEGYEVQTYVLPACAVNAPHRRDRIWFIAKNTKRNGFIQREPDKEGTEIRELRDIGAGNTNRVHISEGFPSNSRSVGWESGNIIGGEIPKEIRGPKSNIGDKPQDATYTCIQRCQRSELNGTLNQGEDGKQAYRPITQLHKIGNWENFPTQPPVCSRNDGISSRLAGITFPKFRNESIKAYGNAIVPEVALQIFRTIQEYETKFK